MIESANRNVDSTGRNEMVVLVHGFGAKRLWMRILERRLQKCGYATNNWSYVSLIGSLEGHARRLRTLLDELAPSQEVVHLVGHSMGAIIVRLALSYGPISSLGRVVLIAPPNHGSPVARVFGPLVWPVCPAASELSSHPDSYVNQIDELFDVQVGVIGARFDLTVPVASTMLNSQSDHVCVAATHNSLLFQGTVACHVDAFLSTGRFRDGQ